MRGGNQWGENNHQWKGEAVSYRSLHKWVHRNFPKPKTCSNCNQIKKLEAANISQKYLRDLLDWEWLCRKCHMIKDGRLNSLHSKEVEEKIATIQRSPKKRKWRSDLAKNRNKDSKGHFI